jgi:hypothetical protein
VQSNSQENPEQEWPAPKMTKLRPCLMKSVVNTTGPVELTAKPSIMLKRRADEVSVSSLCSNGAARDLNESLLQSCIGYPPVPVNIFYN